MDLVLLLASRLASYIQVVGGVQQSAMVTLCSTPLQIVFCVCLLNSELPFGGTSTLLHTTSCMLL